MNPAAVAGVQPVEATMVLVMVLAACDGVKGETGETGINGGAHLVWVRDELSCADGGDSLYWTQPSGFRVAAVHAWTFRRDTTTGDVDQQDMTSAVGADLSGWATQGTNPGATLITCDATYDVTAVVTWAYWEE